MLVDRELTKLQEEDSDLKITRIDIVTNPLQTWKNGIRMFPALKYGDKVLSGFLLSGEEIRKFIDEAKLQLTRSSD
jgi:hypothetical protein